MKMFSKDVLDRLAEDVLLHVEKVGNDRHVSLLDPADATDTVSVVIGEGGELSLVSETGENTLGSWASAAEYTEWKRQFTESMGPLQGGGFVRFQP